MMTHLGQRLTRPDRGEGVARRELGERPGMKFAECRRDDPRRDVFVVCWRVLAYHTAI
jgi:hypothetical protein